MTHNVNDFMAKNKTITQSPNDRPTDTYSLCNMTISFDNIDSEKFDIYMPIYNNILAYRTYIFRPTYTNKYTYTYIHVYKSDIDIMSYKCCLCFYARYLFTIFK